jgi:hypothetical protein
MPLLIISYGLQYLDSKFIVSIDMRVLTLYRDEFGV